ncbi:class I SAM-dependent methyltransferase [Agrobacterium pusense]|uniref:class I SAM-dependent methyltransferase n=1 Tax=Agrobacterium pusense TaxID=648995 RepID=UPI00384F767D|nr:class I SAM-dependent methyltransferase [Agrobacterium sp. S2]
MEFTGERYIPGVGGSIALEHEHRYRMCIDAVKGKKVLDIACGEGFGSALLSKSAEFVFGVDIDADAVKHASTTYTSENVAYLQGSCSQIPLDDCSVDVVVSFETIEHHDEHEQMMVEIRRVLKPGGALIISSPDKKTYTDARNFKNKFHVKELYYHEFQELLDKHFKHVTILGQRIVYGSAIFKEEGKGEIQSYGIESVEPTSGLPDPIYLIAVASDDQGWDEKVRGGLLEETVYRSEAVIEKAHQHNAVLEELRAEIEMLTISKNASEAIKELAGKLNAAMSITDTLLERLQRLENDLNSTTIKYASAVNNPAGASRFMRLAFHRDGRPRGWVRKLILKDRKIGLPRDATKRILLKKDGRVRPCFQKWYSRYDASPELKTNLEYTEFLRETLKSNALGQARTLHIVTTPHTKIIAQLIQEALKNSRFQFSSSTVMPDKFEHDLYIVVAPQMFAVTPPANKTIMFQMEQVRASSWAKDEYILRLSNSLAVIDYSSDNIAALSERALPSKQLYYVPIKPLRLQGSETAEKRDIDVLFYGSIAADRRGRYLNALSEKFNIRVESNLFGGELQDLLKRTKVVANIHFYEEALLETTRLSEALSFGARVVSEESVDQADRTDFADLVDFVPVGDIQSFLSQVQKALDTWDRPAAINQETDFSGMTYHLARVLNGIGAISLEEVFDLCRDLRMPSTRAVLALPEQTERYNFAKRNLLPDAWLFDGLRDIDGWKGCARSYKFLASLALRQDFSNLMIYEDDAGFQVEVKERLQIVEQYLSEDSDWDVFSGLLSDLSDDAVVTKVTNFGGEEFLHLNSVIGMVFGIYNKSALEMLARFEIMGNDTQKHTIDRYLEALSPKCITTLPPIASHSEHLVSTLWPVDNSATIGMISRSLDKLGSKRLSVTHSAGS